MSRDLSPAMKSALLAEYRALPTFTVLFRRHRSTLAALERRGLVESLRLTSEGYLAAVVLAHETPVVPG